MMHLGILMCAERYPKAIQKGLNVTYGYDKRDAIFF